MAVTREISVVGKACPIPLIVLAKEARSLQPGDQIRITGNDPLFEESVREFCSERGHALLETTRQGKVICMLIRI